MESVIKQTRISSDNSATGSGHRRGRGQRGRGVSHTVEAGQATQVEGGQFLQISQAATERTGTIPLFRGKRRTATTSPRSVLSREEEKRVKQLQRKRRE